MSESYSSERVLVDKQKSPEQIAAQIIRITSKLQPRALLTGLELRDTAINPKHLPDGLNLSTGFSGYNVSLIKDGWQTHSLGWEKSADEARLSANREVKQHNDGWIIEAQRITAHPDGKLYTHGSITTIEGSDITTESTDLSNLEIIESAANILSQIHAAVVETNQAKKLINL